MVNMAPEDFYCLHSDLCKTLANARRQQILGVLREDELSVSQMVEATGIPQSNLSQHLGLLRSKGILKVRRDGAHAYYSISNPKIVAAFDLISEVLAEALASQNAAVGAAMNGR